MPKAYLQAGLKTLFQAKRWQRAVPRSMVGIAILVAAAAGDSVAQPVSSFPDRPIRLLVGYPPGGGADTLGRLIARQMSHALEQPVVVENRPGAGQNIATATVAHAPADGYTLLLSSSALGVNLHIYSKIYYDPIGDFAPVAVFGKSPNLLVVRKTAHRLVSRACEQAIAESRHLREVLVNDPAVTERMSIDEIEAAMDPRNYIGTALASVDRVLAAAHGKGS